MLLKKAILRCAFVLGVHVHVLVPEVCMQGVRPCSNPVIARPGAPEVEEWEEGWVEKGGKGWTGAKGGAGGLTTTEIRKDDFEPYDSKGLAAWGIWIRKFLPLFCEIREFHLNIRTT